MKINKCGCGGRARHTTSPNNVWHWVLCIKCKCQTGVCGTKKNAIDVWNTAHPDTSKPTKRIAVLEKECVILRKALEIGVIDRTMGGNRPVNDYIREAQEEK